MRRLAVSVAVLALAAGVFGEDVGWRGNWTGVFPDADPPIKWSKLSNQMKGLRCRAQKPGDDTPAGVSAYCGSLTEWLVLGPFPADEDVQKAVDEEFVKDEATCEPNAGDAVGGLRWKKVEVVGSVVDFASILSKDMPEGTPAFRHAEGLAPHFGKPFVAYAHTYVHSPMEATFRFRVRAVVATKLYVNGKLIEGLKQGGSPYGSDSPATGEFSANLSKGWNRVLLKARNFVLPKKSWRHIRSWYIDLGLRATRPCEIASEGIVWATLLPNYHVACPLVVGDRIFAMSKPGDLVCLRKQDGKVLWVGTTTYYDLLSDKDKRENPAFEKIGPLVAEIGKIDAAYVRQGTLTEETMQTRFDLHKQVIRLMGQADKKYSGYPGHHACGDMPTPVSDGSHVYVWSGLGVASCYDLDGNRKWLTMPGVRDTSPDRSVSPILADGRMVIYNGAPRKGEGELIAFDVQSGAIAWRVPMKRNAMSSPVAVKIGGESFAYHEGCLVRVRDGKVVLDNSALKVTIPTPVVENGVVYGISNGGKVIQAKLPADPANVVMANEGSIGLGGRTGIAGEPFVSSPLYHQGLLYVLDQSGCLHVIDAEAQKIVYERDLGLGKGWPFEFYHAPDWCYPIAFASPMLAGKHIYVFGLNGTAVVFEPGREYREIARNKIEDALLARDVGSNWSSHNRAGGQEIPEHFASSPVAEGGRIYLRGGKYLYCLGEK